VLLLLLLLLCLLLLLLLLIPLCLLLLLPLPSCMYKPVRIFHIFKFSFDFVPAAQQSIETLYSAASHMWARQVGVQLDGAVTEIPTTPASSCPRI
jgi:hypothetical protein